MRVETSLFIVGDGFVGKTTLLKRYVEGLFYDVPRVTIGVDFYLKRTLRDYFMMFPELPLESIFI
ncbi:MAG: hypothetical protein ACTSRT_14545 [Promethearchaeota archaeon]